MYDDFKKIRTNLQEKIQDTFSVDTMSDSQAMEHTKNLIARMRNGRNLQKSLGENFKRTRLQNEYINHKKYEENYIEREDVINPNMPAKERLHFKNYRDAMKRLNIKNSKEEEETERDIAKKAAQETRRNITNEGFVAQWERKQKNLNVDYAHDAEMNMQITNEMDPYYSKIVQPRMSPWAKQRVYLDYQKGMNLRDISLKYAITHKRAAAIIYQKELFFKIMYPKLGETYARFAMDIERQYGEEFGFTDYGVDLEELSLHEQGAPSIVTGRTAVDKYPPKKIQKKIEEKLGSMKNKKIFEVPIRHQGNGPKGYLLQELVCRGGKNAVKPTPRMVRGLWKANKVIDMGY